MFFSSKILLDSKNSTIAEFNALFLKNNVFLIFENWSVVKIIAAPLAA